MSVSAPDKLPQYRASLVPIQIQYTGSAQTKYFSDSRRDSYGESPHDSRQAYFRGLKLVGEQVNTSAYIVNKSEAVVEDGTTTVNRYEAVARFETLDVYGHDSLPPKSSQWRLMQEWETVADILHL